MYWYDKAIEQLKSELDDCLISPKQFRLAILELNDEYDLRMEIDNDDGD